MLGTRFDDPAGVDGSGEGLGLLALETTFAAEKRVQAAGGTFAPLPEPWAKLSGVEVAGYEIRHGISEPEAALEEALPARLGWAAGSVLGVYLHGLFEQPQVVEALLGEPVSRTLEDTFDHLADVVEESLEMRTIAALAGIG